MLTRTPPPSFPLTSSSLVASRHILDECRSRARGMIDVRLHVYEAAKGLPDDARGNGWYIKAAVYIKAAAFIPHPPLSDATR